MAVGQPDFNYHFSLVDIELVEEGSIIKSTDLINRETLREGVGVELYKYFVPPEPTSWNRKCQI